MLTRAAAGLLVVLATVGGVRLWQSAGPLCANKETASYPAPGGRHRAVVFERNCGATTGLSTHLSVLRGSSPLPNAAGNALVWSLPADGANVAVSWSSPARLDVAADVPPLFKGDLAGVTLRLLPPSR